MNVSGIAFRFIFYRVLSNSPITGIPFLHSSNVNELRTLIECNKQCRIILVCKEDHMEDLYHTIVERNIDEIFVLGDSTKFDMENKKITMVNTNEQDLTFEVLCQAIRYIHREEMIQRRQENHGLANTLSADILKLLGQVKSLL